MTRTTPDITDDDLDDWAPDAAPDGIDIVHARPRGRLHQHATPLSLIVLGALLGAAMLGVLGGGRSPVTEAHGAVATMSVKTPAVARSGLFYETTISVSAREPIADPVIALPPELWRDQTINTMIPAAETEAFADGLFRFHYAAMRAGDTLIVKIDGQINPPLTAGTRGNVVLLDGDRAIAKVPLSIRILP